MTVSTTRDGDVAVRVEFAKLAAKQRVRAWTRLVALTAAHPDRRWRAVTVGRGSRGGVAVASADVKALTRVPGIGPKGAQRIIVELKNKLGTPEEAVNAALGDGGRAEPPWREQVHSGLVGLGYSARDADEAVAAVAPQADAEIAAGRTPDVAALLKAALRVLSVR